ncbi:MAG: redoxin domain-containing protein [Rhodospirillales bacterium]|jgi:peroxiredoxin
MIELEALCEIIKPLEGLGATLLMVTPQQPAFSKKLIEERNLNYGMLSDIGNRYAETLGLKFSLPEKIIEIYSANGIDIPAANGDDSWALPVPGRLVVDRQGIIRSTSFDPDYTHRPEPEATVQVVKEL